MMYTIIFGRRVESGAGAASGDAAAEFMPADESRAEQSRERMYGVAGDWRIVSLSRLQGYVVGR